MFKKMFSVLVGVMMLGLGAVAQAQEVNLAEMAGVFGQQKSSVCYMQSYEIDIKSKDEGKKAKAQFEGWANTNPMFLSNLVSKGVKVSSNTNVSLKSDISSKAKITYISLDLVEAIKLHRYLMSVTTSTQSRGYGAYYQWNSEFLPVDPEFREVLDDNGMHYPVKMTIIGMKEKNPIPEWVNVFRPIVGLFGVINTARNWNSDYLDLTGLETAVNSLTPVVAPRNGAMQIMVGNQSYDLSELDDSKAAKIAAQLHS